jgi:acetyl esterase/lipase
VFPAAVEDSKCAVRWLRAHAQQYNIDPERIGVWGSSAGGHLSLMVACADESAGMEGGGGWSNFSSRVQAACSYWGVASMIIAGEPFEQDYDHQSAIVQFIGGLPSEIPEVYELASPVTHVSPDDPPILLVHGDMDPLVSLRQSQIMYQAYLDLDLETELIVVNGAGHGLKQMADNPISPSQEVVDQIVLEFFIEHLVIQVSNN